jgi:hypothetical protein
MAAAARVEGQQDGLAIAVCNALLFSLSLASRSQQGFISVIFFGARVGFPSWQKPTEPTEPVMRQA